MELKEKAKQLLEAGEVKVVIGFTAGTFGRRRPFYARTPAEADRLVMDEACEQNLATYVTRKEVKRLGKVAVAAKPGALRALLQLMAERQIKEGDLLPLAIGADGQVEELATAQAVEERLALEPFQISAKDRELLDKLNKMTREERFAFWQSELSRCIKCYACRSSCPMCYCEHCTMDCNRPQWVPVPSHAQGNLEYHQVRAMHLAGRCVECGDCGRACPVDIPVHLLTFTAEECVHAQFGQRAGASAKLDYALSTFRPDDKETFIR
jgi:formate dehydrogenase (coenzyme F420) beta subunit